MLIGYFSFGRTEFFSKQCSRRVLYYMNPNGGYTIVTDVRRNGSSTQENVHDMGEVVNLIGEDSKIRQLINQGHADARKVKTARKHLFALLRKNKCKHQRLEKAGSVYKF